MADGAIAATRTPWGYAVSVSGGTGTVTTNILPKGNSLNLKGIYMVGQATTDIYTVTDAAGVVIAKVASGTLYDNPKTIPLYNSRIDGMSIVFGGASSTGLMSIFLE